MILWLNFIMFHYPGKKIDAMRVPPNSEALSQKFFFYYFQDDKISSVCLFFNHVSFFSIHVSFFFPMIILFMFPFFMIFSFVYVSCLFVRRPHQSSSDFRDIFFFNFITNFNQREENTSFFLFSNV